MKQLISVRAIIQKEDKTLLVKRANGRASILGKYELPGGKIGYGEQPEDALSRYVKDDVGMVVRTAQLFDVITYIDHDDRDTQYTFLLYVVNLGENGNRVELSQNYNHYRWSGLHDMRQDELTESSKLLLGILQQKVGTTKKEELVSLPVSSDDMKGAKVIAYSDGGSRGNPGPSASGFIIMNDREDVLHQGGMYLGITTNNQAEYNGILLGLEKALEMGAAEVDFRMDSLLAVNQLNGIYKVKNADLMPVYERIKELAKKFNRVTFTHVRREYNQLADGMVNKILDAHEETGV